MTNTYSSIQLVGWGWLVDEIAVKSHTARLTERNTSDDEIAVKAITQSSFDGGEHE